MLPEKCRKHWAKIKIRTVKGFKEIYMNNHYMNEVLPRWQFYKETLILNLEMLKRYCKEGTEFYSKMLAETKEAKTAERVSEITCKLNVYMLTCDVLREEEVNKK